MRVDANCQNTIGVVSCIEGISIWNLFIVAEAGLKDSISKILTKFKQVLLDSHTLYFKSNMVWKSHRF